MNPENPETKEERQKRYFKKATVIPHRDKLKITPSNAFDSEPWKRSIEYLDSLSLFESGIKDPALIKRFFDDNYERDPVKSVYKKYQKIISKNLSKKLFSPVLIYRKHFGSNKWRIVDYLASNATINHFEGQDIDLDKIKIKVNPEDEDLIYDFVSDIVDAYALIKYHKSNEKLCKVRLDTCERLIDVFEEMYSSKANENQVFLEMLSDIYNEGIQLLGDKGQNHYRQFYNVIKRNLSTYSLFIPAMERLRGSNAWKKERVIDYLASKRTIDQLIEDGSLDDHRNRFKPGLCSNNASVLYEFVHNLIEGWAKILLKIEADQYGNVLTNDYQARLEACTLLRKAFKDYGSEVDSVANEHSLLKMVVEDIEYGLQESMDVKKAQYLFF